MSIVARGLLLAFEGLDQSGKQTQAERLHTYLTDRGRQVRLLSFPDYSTPIGREIALALKGERDFGPDVMQLLYVANRHERCTEIEATIAAGGVIICDRYTASSVAYGEAQGLDGAWLRDIQRFLPKPDLTILLDMPPGVSAQRKTTQRDKYERDLALLERVRTSYLAQVEPDWLRLDADRPREQVASEIASAAASLLQS